MDKQSISIKVISELAVVNDTAQLEKCMDSQLSAGTNTCLCNTGTEAAVAALAKAAFVRGTIDKEGMPSLISSLTVCGIPSRD